MKHALVVALAGACVAAAVGAMSCKSNVITQNTTNESFESSVTQTAGPMGLDVIGPDRSEANIPAGALAESTDITIGKLKVDGGYPALPSGWAFSGGVYAFKPHAQTFAMPVAITVPYVDQGKPVRLATSEPGGGWSTIDGVPIKGGFAVTSSTHFSYYAVVTGAPPDPTMTDGGVDATVMDAQPDTAPDSAPEAGPPTTTLFAVSSTSGTVYRLELTASVVVPTDGGAMDAGDAGDAGDAAPAPTATVVPGHLDDGGLFTVDGAAPSSLAMAPSPYTLYAGGMNDGGGAVVAVSDPFGATPAIAGLFNVASPGPMTFSDGELWTAVGNPPDVETFVNGTKNWPPSVIISNAMPYRGMAIDPAHKVLYIGTQIPSEVQRWQLAGTGATKQAIQQTSLSTGGASPGGITIAPWGEVVVVLPSLLGVRRFDLVGNSKGSNTLAFGVGSPIAAVHWPSGVDELFLYDADMRQVVRVTFLDAAHTQLVEAARIGFGVGDPIDALLVAP